MKSTSVKVVHLDTQYRMLPILNKFSSENFYNGAVKVSWLNNDASRMNMISSGWTKRTKHQTHRFYLLRVVDIRKRTVKDKVTSTDLKA